MIDIAITSVITTKETQVGILNNAWLTIIFTPTHTKIIDRPSFRYRNLSIKSAIKKYIERSPRIASALLANTKKVTVNQDLKADKKYAVKLLLQSVAIAIVLTALVVLL